MGVSLAELGGDYKKIVQGKFSSKVDDFGNVRHPRRLIKIYREVFYRKLSVNSWDFKTVDGPGTVYLRTIYDVYKIIDEAEKRKRFQDKWIHFAFLKGDDQQWYVYDPSSSNIKESYNKQMDKFGAYGFSKVDDQLVEENRQIALLTKGVGTTYELRVIDKDLLNCTFGYNYDQPAMQVSITVSNDKGKNRGIYHSGDVIKIYMWYDNPNKIQFTQDVNDWTKNTVVNGEDKALHNIRQKHYETATTGKGGKKVSYDVTPARGRASNGVVLMFTGKVDDVSYDYSKSGGNKLMLKGRSLGSALTDVRIYKSYPSEGRISMPHEEVIYDMVSSQVGLPFGHLILTNVDWAIGSIPPKGQRQPGSMIKLGDLIKTGGADDLDDINRKEIEAGADTQYLTEVAKGIKDQEREWIDNIAIKNVVTLSDDFIKKVFENTNNITANDPVNDGKAFDIKKEVNSVTEAELEGKGSSTPLWIYKDGKTGKTYNAGYPSNTSLATILQDLIKLNRKMPVELKPEQWSEYGIRVPQPIKRKDEKDPTKVKSINATRLFFIDGWNAVKYIMQQRAITTSAVRATKIEALMALNDPEIDWKEISGPKGLVPKEGKISAIWPKKEVKGYGEGKIILYQVPSKGKFNVIEFAKSLNIITKEEVYEPKELEKKVKNKQKGGSFLLVEEALDPKSTTYRDALLRVKLFYQKVRQFTRAFHDMKTIGKRRAAYPNTDALLSPVNFGSAYAVEFPTVKQGQIIVLPLDVLNAPRQWVVGAASYKNDSTDRWEVDLTEGLLGIYEGDNQDFKSYPHGSAFDQIVPEERRSSDELDPKGITGGTPPVGMSKIADWKMSFDDNYTPTQDVEKGVQVTFKIIEDAKLLRQIKKFSNDLIFDGVTIFEAVKKVTSQYFDIIQFVDEFGFYNVRPRFASGIDQRKVLTLEAGQNTYPKLISSKAEENSSQTINRVVLIGKSPGFTEVVIVIVSDDESISRHGVKQDFAQMNKIDNVIDAIKTAKKKLLGFRQRIRKVQIVCEPILDLRPGHHININDINSALAGPYLVTNVGINYSKSGGAVQTFNAYSVGDFYNTDDLSGQVSYYSKEGGDVLKKQKQYSEKQFREEKNIIQKVTG